MDYYKRKEKAVTLIKKLLDKGVEREKINHIIESTFYLTPKFTNRQIDLYIGDV